VNASLFRHIRVLNNRVLDLNVIAGLTRNLSIKRSRIKCGMTFESSDGELIGSDSTSRCFKRFIHLQLSIDESASGRESRFEEPEGVIIFCHCVTTPDLSVYTLSTLFGSFVAIPPTLVGELLHVNRHYESFVWINV
jgi:hypothetical protein